MLFSFYKTEIQNHRFFIVSVVVSVECPSSVRRVSAECPLELCGKTQRCKIRVKTLRSLAQQSFQKYRSKVNTMPGQPHGGSNEKEKTSYE